MHHLILGYGYCGSFLAQELLKNGQRVTAVSRHLNQEEKPAQLNHICQDITQKLNWMEPETILYYLIPPPTEGEKDTVLQQVLKNNPIKAKKVVYFGSSGVYGQYNGALVNEDSPCHIHHSRQLRRLDAEHQWLSYCEQHAIEPIILRIGGIYGPQRLPVEAAQNGTALIEPSKAPFINHIYVKDLAAIAYLLVQREHQHSIFNSADGTPKPMGSLQQEVAKALHFEPAPYESFESAWEKASPMKREFMQGSKRLNIERLKESLGNSFSFTPLEQAIEDSLKNENERT